MAAVAFIGFLCAINVSEETMMTHASDQIKQVIEEGKDQLKKVPDDYL